MNETLPAKDQSNLTRCEATHSPLPWKIALIGTKAQAFGGSLEDADGNQIDLVTVTRSGSHFERTENAAYIVKACNQFPELLRLSRALAMVVLQSDIYHLAKGEVDDILEITKNG